MTDFNEKVSVDIVNEVKNSFINAEILEITFVNVFDSCLEGNKIKAPHWPASKYGLDLSDKPVVYPINKAGTYKAKIKVKVTSENVSGSGKLIGVIKGFKFEGDIPLSSGEHNVDVGLTNTPTCISWIYGNVLWGVEGGGHSVNAGKTNIEMFFVFGNPSDYDFFAKEGVWAEALRFQFKKSRIKGLDNEVSAQKEIASFCFELDNHKYDIERGAPSFGGASGAFKLKKYMSPSSGNVNCYDQTYAVIVFCGAIGISVDALYMNPFGFLNTTNLVGWGRCNNPFPKKSPKSKYLVVNDNDKDRSPFGNHMFCECKKQIYDACAGPVVGEHDRKSYVKANIDDKTELNKLYGGFPGSVANISLLSNEVASVE
jgi:hypothetical protein